MLAFSLALDAGPATFEERKAGIRILLERRDFAEALTKAKALNRDWPDDIAGYQLLADAHLGIGNYEDAERAIQWMLDLRIGKTDSAGWLLLAHLREVTGDIEGALDSLSQANLRLSAAQDRERSRLLIHTARLHLIAGRLGLADRALAAAAWKDDRMAIDTFARLRVAQGKPEEALQILRRKSGNTHPSQLYRIAEISRDAADYQAFEKAAQAVRGLPDNANAELALYYAGQGKRTAEAVEIAKQESSRTHDVYTMSALAVALFANGQVVEAKSVIGKVVGVGTRDPEILRHAERMGVKPE